MARRALGAAHADADREWTLGLERTLAAGVPPAESEHNAGPASGAPASAAAADSDRSNSLICIEFQVLADLGLILHEAVISGDDLRAPGARRRERQ